ncbi:MAG: hypothetical protein D6690_09250 [Nitrospirae bacterium]|nr:MAG: hypothetical protein D6690_09250 [Nitrospirota bacterium]
MKVLLTMRNRIACSAQSLIQLEPGMIQSVVGGQVYKLGNQYFSENRVRILEAEPSQVTAEVNGTFGVYSQLIKLRGGTLITKCSCPSTEQPFCRHCVAVLLQLFHDGMAKQSGTSLSEPASSAVTDPLKASESAGRASGDFHFREVTCFVDWMQGAVGYLGTPQSLPPAPDLPPGGVRSWIATLTELHQRLLQSEEDRIHAQNELQYAGTRIKDLELELNVARREMMEVQGACVGLQKELERCQDLLAEFDAVTKERDRLISTIKTMKDELQKKCAELDSLSLTIKTVSKAIHGILPS